MDYTNIPDNLEAAQEMIRMLLDEAAASARMQQEMRKDLDAYTAMVQAARKALNAVEAPAK